MSKDLSTFLKISAIAVLIVIVSTALLTTGSGDIHIHDTYFVMSSLTQLLFFTLVSLFLIGLVASIWTRFRNKLYIKILLFSAFLLISFGMYISLFVK